MDNTVSLSRVFLTGILEMESELRNIAYSRDYYQSGVYTNEWEFTPDIKEQNMNLKRLVASYVGNKSKIKNNLDSEINKTYSMIRAKQSRYDLFKKDNNNLKQAIDRWVNLGNRQLKGLLKDKHTTELLSEYGTVMLERI